MRDTPTLTGDPAKDQLLKDQWLDEYYRAGKFSGGGFYLGDPGAYAFHESTGGYDAAAAAGAARAWLAEHPKPLVNGRPPGVDQATRDAILGTARTGMQSAFTNYGVDPATYSTDIEDRLASILAGIPQDTQDISTFFPTDLGTKLIGELETGRRNKLLNEFDTNVPSEFIPMTSDDAFIDAILGEQRTDADQFIQRMLDRGQINKIGADAAIADLDRQAGLGKTRLSEIGTGLIGAREAELDTDWSTRKSNIGKLKLGDAFDPVAQRGEIDTLANDFIGTLDTGLRSGLGAERLFNVSGLPAVAGAKGTTTDTITGQPQEDDDDEVLKTGSEVLF